MVHRLTLRLAEAERPCRATILFATFCAGLISPALANTAEFDELDNDVQERITASCLPVRLDVGIDAWRACIESEALKQTSSRAPVVSLGLDEQFALSRLCERSSDPECRARELEQLTRVPPPVLSDLRDDERHALARACFSVQQTQGPSAWRTCMGQQATVLRASLAVDLNALNLVDRNLALNNCSADTNVAGYRDCLAGAGAPHLDVTLSALVLPEPQLGPEPPTLEPNVAAAQPASRPDPRLCR